MGKSRGQLSWLPGLSGVLSSALWGAEHIAGVTWKWRDSRRSAACCSLAATSESHKSLSRNDSFLYKCCKWDMYQGYSSLLQHHTEFHWKPRSWIKEMSLFSSNASSWNSLVNVVLEGSEIQREKEEENICLKKKLTIVFRFLAYAFGIFGIVTSIAEAAMQIWEWVVSVSGWLN